MENLKGLDVKKKQYRINSYTVELVRDASIVADSRKADEPSKVAEIFRSFIGNTDREIFAAILTDSRNKVIGINQVSVGTLSSSLVHPREVFKPAILACAAAIIVAHNHPSGDATPSPEDKVATRRIKEAGELLGIPLLDHVILGENFFSFREQGLLNY